MLPAESDDASDHKNIRWMRRSSTGCPHLFVEQSGIKIRKVRGVRYLLERR
jgi:hypothetical protein